MNYKRRRRLALALLSALAFIGGSAQATRSPPSSDAIDRIDEIGAAWRAFENGTTPDADAAPNPRISQFWNNWPNWNNWLNWNNWPNWGNWANW